MLYGTFEFMVSSDLGEVESKVMIKVKACIHKSESADEKIKCLES